MTVRSPGEENYEEPTLHDAIEQVGPDELLSTHLEVSHQTDSMKLWLAGKINDLQVNPLHFSVPDSEASPGSSNLEAVHAMERERYPSVFINVPTLSLFYIENQSDIDRVTGWQCCDLYFAIVGDSPSRRGIRLVGRSMPSWELSTKDGRAQAEKDCINRMQTSVYLSHYLRIFQRDVSDHIGAQKMSEATLLIAENVEFLKVSNALVRLLLLI